MNKEFKETDLINSAESRKECMEHAKSRLDVLDKVKKLMLIPEIQSMTSTQVAEYFEVPVDTVKHCYYRNVDELQEAGVFFTTPTDLVKNLEGTRYTLQKDEKQSFKPTRKVKSNNRGQTALEINEEVVILINNKGAMIFPKLAILNLAMLLEESPVAKAIRQEILNIVQIVYDERPEILTARSDEEYLLIATLYQGLSTGNIELAMRAYSGMIQLHNKYRTNAEAKIKSLSNANKLLKNEIVTLSDRQGFNKVVRRAAKEVNQPIENVYGSIYSHLENKYSISLKKRRGRSGKSDAVINYIRDDEWGKLQNCVVAYLEDHGVDGAAFIQKHLKAN